MLKEIIPSVYHADYSFNPFAWGYDSTIWRGIDNYGKRIVIKVYNQHQDMITVEELKYYQSITDQAYRLFNGRKICGNTWFITPISLVSTTLVNGIYHPCTVCPEVEGSTLYKMLNRGNLYHNIANSLERVSQIINQKLAINLVEISSINVKITPKLEITDLIFNLFPNLQLPKNQN